MRLLLERGTYPAIQRLWLLDQQLYEGELDKSFYSTFNRRDLIANKTWAIPFRDIALDKESKLTRTPEGREILSYGWAIEAVIECETWIDVVGGFRFPAALLATEEFHRHGYLTKPLPVESVESYHARFPRRSCDVWAHERETGMRLLDPVEREGLMDTSPVVEMTPSGWRRDEFGHIARVDS